LAFRDPYKEAPRRLADAKLNGEPIALTLKPGRRGYLQVVKGAVTVNGVSLEAGDGARIEEEGALEIAAREQSEVLVFDLA